MTGNCTEYGTVTIRRVRSSLKTSVFLFQALRRLARELVGNGAGDTERQALQNLAALVKFWYAKEQNIIRRLLSHARFVHHRPPDQSVFTECDICLMP